MSPETEEGCGPYTDPASKDCTLPSGARNLPGSFPIEKRMDAMIESRYGKPTDVMSQMKFTGDKSSDTNRQTS